MDGQDMEGQHKGNTSEQEQDAFFLNLPEEEKRRALAMYLGLPEDASLKDIAVAREKADGIVRESKGNRGNMAA